MSHRLRTLFAVALLMFAQATLAVPLAQIEHIAASGAPGLALELIDAEQPPLAKRLGDWFEWERSRINILAGWQQWARAQQRLADIDTELPPKLRRWARGQRAWLYLEAGDAPAALELLRGLIWRFGLRAEAQELALWRRLVIRAYLLDDHIVEADIALHRYEQDYPAEGGEWARLRAELWLRSGRADLVMGLKANERAALPAPLLLFAELRSDRTSAGKAYAQASEQAQDEKLAPALRSAWWRVALAAARVQESPGRIAHALESALMLGDQRVDRSLPQTSASALWQAWREYGQTSANEAQLLAGDEASWLAAVETAQKNTPVRARALLAVLSEQRRGDWRDRALLALAERIAAVEPAGATLLLGVFLDRELFPQLDDVPAAVRHKLVEEALRREDIALASRLMAGLTERPENVSEFDWALRRARVLVMGGEVDVGVAALTTLIQVTEQFSEAEADRLLQVIFDLQAVGQHPAALDAMLAVQPKLSNIRQQREMFFWRGDSQAAQGRLAEAARLYMRSATLLDPAGVDQWGQSARYRAAEVLTEAGLVGDARRLYEKLLGETESPNRQAVLRNRLQQLWLAPRAAGDVLDSQPGK
jgi:hypothetical protein